MSDETQPETPISEPTPQPTPELIIETIPVPEPVPEPSITEPPQTAQPVEPLSEEPTLEPTPAPEPVPKPTPTPTPKSVQIPQTQITTQPVIQTSLARELLIKARGAIQFRKRKKLEKIMGLFLKKQSITNDDVQKLLYVSDATATRYLKQLETEGRIRRQGVPGHASYSRI